MPSKYKNYQEFENAKIKCKTCYIGKYYNKVVLSDGYKKDPIILIIGEAPGKTEVELETPFIGASGKLLRKTLNDFGFNKGNSLITNIIPCRPLDNKFPTDKDVVAKCMQLWLKEEIILTNPKCLLLVGAKPLSYILSFKTNNDRYIINNGEWFGLNVNGNKIKCLATYHPAFILRKGYDKNILESFRNHIKKVADVFIGKKEDKSCNK